MPPIDYVLTKIACFVSIFLVGYYGFHGVGAQWVFGAMAILWSFMMVMRLTLLTTPIPAPNSSSSLAKRLLFHLHERQYAKRQFLLQKSLSGSFLSFFFGVFLLIAWQIFCTALPATMFSYDGVQAAMDNFNIDYHSFWQKIYSGGQYFILAVTIAMMAFVVRSHCAQKSFTRVMMIIFASYAVSGFILFAGLYNPSDLAFLSQNNTVSWGGAGLGSSLGAGFYNKAAGQIPNLFDIVLIEGGIVGLGIVTFLLFIPLATICLGAQNNDTDVLTLVCSIIIGIVLIMSAFLPFGAAVGGFMLLCLIGLFVGWGAVDVGLATNMREKSY